MDIILSYLLQHICDLMSLANLTELPHRIDKFLWAFRQKRRFRKRTFFELKILYLDGTQKPMIYVPIYGMVFTSLEMI